MFDAQPTLTGELVHARPLRAADFDGLYAVAADPLLWAQHPQQDRHQQDVFRRFFLDALSSGGALAVVDGRDHRIIGTSRYHGHDAQRREIEIGWIFFARSHWGGAHNGELKHLMLRCWPRPTWSSPSSNGRPTASSGSPASSPTASTWPAYST